jgi:hypothetical protein
MISPSATWHTQFNPGGQFTVDSYVTRDASGRVRSREVETPTTYSHQDLDQTAQIVRSVYEDSDYRVTNETKPDGTHTSEIADLYAGTTRLAVTLANGDRFEAESNGFDSSTRTFNRDGSVVSTGDNSNALSYQFLDPQGNWSFFELKKPSGTTSHSTGSPNMDVAPGPGSESI